MGAIFLFKDMKLFIELVGLTGIDRNQLTKLKE